MSNILALKTTPPPHQAPNATPNLVPREAQAPSRDAVRLNKLHRQFGEQVILNDLDLNIAEGEFVALLGASGSGKTTLLRILAGLDAPDGGEAWVPDARTVVFQEPRLLPSQPVWRNILVGLNNAKSQKARAVEALQEVGLAHRVEAWPSTLSGGEAQRAALARALVREPRLLLLDEPFAALDALTRLRMQQLVKDLCASHGPATLLVTHDVDEAILLADRILVLKSGAIAFDERVDVPSPRRSSSAEFDHLRQRLLSELGVEHHH